MKRFVIIILLFLIASNGCCAGSVEEEFFREDVVTRSTRLAKYRMDDQWRIFLYGNQVIHPPATGMAEVLARQGEPMLRFILERLNHSKNDLDFRDSMVVFQMMQWHGDYAICSNQDVLSQIKSNQTKVNNPDWRNVYLEMLNELCR